MSSYPGGAIISGVFKGYENLSRYSPIVVAPLYTLKKNPFKDVHGDSSRATTMHILMKSDEVALSKIVKRF